MTDDDIFIITIINKPHKFHLSIYLKNAAQMNQVRWSSCINTSIAGETFKLWSKASSVSGASPPNLELLQTKERTQSTGSHLQQKKTCLLNTSWSWAPSSVGNFVNNVLHETVPAAVGSSFHWSAQTTRESQPELTNFGRTAIKKMILGRITLSTVLHLSMTS